MKKTVQYDWLDLVRGLAALAVFIGHLRIICFRDVPVGTLNTLGKGVFFMTGFMHISVILFFVLSGFLIIKSIHESVLRNSWNTSSYAQNRLFRLWVVLIPCLILGLIFDKAGLAYFGDSLFYSNQWKYFLGQDLANKLSAPIFFGNLFFLQKTLFPTLGSNGALWSLANEFWYYVTFPLLYFAILNRYALKYRILLFAAAVLVLVFVGFQITITFPIWLTGGLSYIIARKVKPEYLKNKLLLVSVVLIFLVAVLMTRIKLYPELFNNYTVGVLFALTIPFLINVEMKSRLIKAISTYLSNISYTLYLAHLPFIYIVTSAIGFQDKEWSSRNFIIYLGIVLATMLYATLLWFIFERNTKKIRNWFTSRIPALNSN